MMELLVAVLGPSITKGRSWREGVGSDRLMTKVSERYIADTLVPLDDLPPNYQHDISHGQPSPQPLL